MSKIPHQDKIILKDIKRLEEEIDAKNKALDRLAEQMNNAEIARTKASPVEQTKIKQDIEDLEEKKNDLERKLEQRQQELARKKLLLKTPILYETLFNLNYIEQLLTFKKFLKSKKQYFKVIVFKGTANCGLDILFKRTLHLSGVHKHSRIGSPIDFGKPFPGVTMESIWYLIGLSLVDATDVKTKDRIEQCSGNEIGAVVSEFLTSLLKEKHVIIRCDHINRLPPELIRNVVLKFCTEFKNYTTGFASEKKLIFSLVSRNTSHPFCERTFCGGDSILGSNNFISLPNTSLITEGVIDHWLLYAQQKSADLFSYLESQWNIAPDGIYIQDFIRQIETITGCNDLYQKLTEL